jgi:hypothetical protein
MVEYQVALNVPAPLRGIYPDSAKVSTDRSGRLLTFSEAISRTTDGAQYSVRYGPQSVTLPDAADVVDATQLDRAMLSAHLPEALAFVAEMGYVSGQPATGTETVTQFRAAVRTVAADPDNNMAGIAVTVADVSNGVTLTAQNPFTNANVTVRAVVDSHGWLSVTDSAGRPVDAYGIVIGTVGLRAGHAVALRTGRTASLRMGHTAATLGRAAAVRFGIRH